jgi:hypothetical protein
MGRCEDVDSRIVELMDPRTFKASRSRRVNDIEFRINVCPSPRPASAGKGVLARVMAKGSRKGGRSKLAY